MMTPPSVTSRLARRSTKSRRLPFDFDMGHRPGLVSLALAM